MRKINENNLNQRFYDPVLNPGGFGGVPKMVLPFVTEVLNESADGGQNVLTLIFTFRRLSWKMVYTWDSKL